MYWKKYYRKYKKLFSSISLYPRLCSLSDFILSITPESMFRMYCFTKLLLISLKSGYHTMSIVFFNSWRLTITAWILYVWHIDNGCNPLILNDMSNTFPFFCQRSVAKFDIFFFFCKWLPVWYNYLMLIKLYLICYPRLKSSIESVLF